MESLSSGIEELLCADVPRSYTRIQTFPNHTSRICNTGLVFEPDPSPERRKPWQRSSRVRWTRSAHEDTNWEANSSNETCSPREADSACRDWSKHVMRQPSARKHRSQASSLILENPPRPNQKKQESQDSGHFNELCKGSSTTFPFSLPIYTGSCSGHPHRKKILPIASKWGWDWRSHSYQKTLFCQYCPTSWALQLYINI